MTMPALGRYHRLELLRITDSGAVLAAGDGEILLPGAQIPDGAKPGDMLEVFLYLDSADRPIATTRHPKAMVGEFALLEVKDISKVGAFLDWGLDKDLLVPFAEQPVRMRKRERHIVRLYLDNTGRIAASAKLDSILEMTNTDLAEGEAVELMIYAFTDLGAKVIINNRYSGLLFKNELYGKPELGQRLTGYVKRIRDDRKIDVALRQGGAQEANADRDRLLQALKEGGGFLPLTDKSDPDAVSGLLRMSKKSFKKAVGGLYKEGLITMTDTGIALKKQQRERG